MPTTVALNVRAEMARRQRSQEDLATHLGVSQAAISRRLNGEVDFTTSQIEAIAGYLEVPVTAFFNATALAEGGDAA